MNENVALSTLMKYSIKCQICCDSLGKKKEECKWRVPLFLNQKDFLHRSVKSFCNVVPLRKAVSTFAIHSIAPTLSFCDGTLVFELSCPSLSLRKWNSRKEEREGSFFRIPLTRKEEEADSLWYVVSFHLPYRVLPLAENLFRSFWNVLHERDSFMPWESICRPSNCSPSSQWREHMLRMKCWSREDPRLALFLSATLQDKYSFWCALWRDSFGFICSREYTESTRKSKVDDSRMPIRVWNNNSVWKLTLSSPLVQQLVRQLYFEGVFHDFPGTSFSDSLKTCIAVMVCGLSYSTQRLLLRTSYRKAVVQRRLLWERILRVMKRVQQHSRKRLQHHKYCVEVQFGFLSIFAWGDLSLKKLCTLSWVSCETKNKKKKKQDYTFILQRRWAMEGMNLTSARLCLIIPGMRIQPRLSAWSLQTRTSFFDQSFFFSFAVSMHHVEKPTSLLYSGMTAIFQAKNNKASKSSSSRD